MKRILLLIFGMLSCWVSSSAQGTISTFAVYPNNNGSSAVSFELESTTPIEVTDIANLWNNGTTTTDVWIKVGGITTTTSPLVVSTANGWVQHQVGATVVGNGTTPASITNLIPIAIPANTPVGIAISGGMRYSGTNGAPPTPTTFTDGPVTLRTGGTKGYGGLVPNLTNNPRGFLGTMSYVLGVQGNCTAFSNFLIDSITGTAAKLAWTPGVGNTSFFMEYGPAGFTPGTGTPVSGTYPTTQNPYIFTSLSPSTTYDVYFGEICNSGLDSVFFPAAQQFTTTQSCTAPVNFTISNILSTSADLSWNSIGTSTGFKLISGPAGFDPQTAGTVNTTASSPYTLGSLSGTTDYDVYLLADCGGGSVSDTVGPISFKTACAPEVVGYFNGFEGDVLNASPLCWENYLTAANATSRVIAFTVPNTGTQHLQVSSSTSNATTDTVMLISPMLVNLNSGLNQVRFFSKTDNVGVELIVGTVTDPLNPQSFSAVDTVRFNSTLTYEEYIIPMSLANGYNGSDLYVAFKMDRTLTFQEFYLDDFNYEVTPPCGKITGGIVTGVTGTSVTLSFNSSGTTAGYEWGPVGFSQGTGTTDSIQGNPITVGGLSPSTSYDIYIRNDCRAAGSGTSIWSGPFTFTTLCAVLQGPYFQNFESSTVGHWDGIEDCWAYDANNPGTTSSGGYSWEIRNTSQTTSGGTGPDRDNTLAPAIGGNFITADVSGSSTAGPDSVMLTSPMVDITSLLVPELTFYYHKHGTNMPDLNVDVWSGGVWNRGVSVIPGTTQLSPSDPYLKGTLDLSSYGDTVMVRFRVLTTGCCAADVALDDIRIDEQPTCDAPSLLSLLNKTSSSGVINWVPGGSAVATNIEYGITGFTPGTGMNIISNDTIDTISGLNSNTTYDVYIYDSCGVGNGNSFLIGPITFTTKCLINPTSLPWSDGFESYAAGPYLGSTDFCNPTYTWEFLATTNGRLRVAAGVAYPKTGTNAFTLDKSGFSSPATANFLTLNVDLSNYTSAAGIELSFSVLESLQEPNADNRVWVKGSSGDPWIQIIDLDQFTISGTYVDIANVDIVNPLANAGQTVGAETQIRFGQAGTTTSSSATCCDGFTFDDVSLVEVTCPTPTGLTATGITDGAANLTWNPTTPSVNYEVWFGPVGFSQGSNTTGGVRVFTGGPDSLHVDTLSSRTCYEFLLRYVCAPGDTSIWAGPFTFCTECATYNAPYVETFESAGTAVGHYDGINGDCWDFSSNNSGTTSSGGYSWEVRNTSQTTSGTGTGPDRDNTLAPATGGNFITADVSGSNAAIPDSTLLTSPVIDISGLLTPEFQFFYHMHGTGMADLHVDIWNGNSWDRDEIVITGTQNTSQADPYKDTIYDLAAYIGQTNLKVRFRGLTNGCCSGDIAIDDIRISDPVSCIKPENLSATGITASAGNISWTAAAGQTGSSFQVSNGVNINDPNLGTMTVQSATTMSLTNLGPNSNNCFYVREICGPGDTSLWAGPFCFKTLCSAFTAPYFQDFESSVVGHFDGEEDCWDYFSNNAGTTSSGGYSWEVRNTAQVTSGTGTGPDRDNTLAPAIGGHFVTADVSGSSTAGPDSSLITSPGIDISGLTNPELEYHYHMHGTGMADFYVDLWNGTSWDRGVHLITGTQNTSQADPYHDTIINLAAYSGQTDFRARFRVLTNGCCSGDVAIDDIRISNPVSVSCPAPTAFTSGQVDCNQIEFTWNSGTGSSLIQYGPTGFTLGSGTYTNVVTSPFFVTGLSPVTSYDFYLADTCGNDTSIWVGPFNETTIVCPAGCLNPTGLSAASITCGSADLTWVSGPNTIASAVEWGATGFTIGSGTPVGPASSPLTINGLSPGTSYDFYVRDYCSTDTSAIVGPFTFTTLMAPITASFTTSLQAATLTNRIVDVDATGSQGATSYTWDWGDGTPLSTVSSSSTFHSYTANGGYNIKLVVTGDCGVDSSTVNVLIGEISLTENDLGRSFSMYPNPTSGFINLSFETNSRNAIISIMDLSGKTLRSIEAENIDEVYSHKLDVVDFAKGTYILRIESGDLAIQRRIVKR